MAKKKPANQPKLISNRRARHDYELGDSLVVGIVLSGAETKALRMGHGHLRGAYVTIKNDELFLINGTIVGTSGVRISEQDQTRTRKLLASRREISHLEEAKKQGRTIVPLEVLTGGRYIKVRIAIGKGRKNYDKRQAIKSRDESRHMSAVIKSSLHR
ncbi:MAG TPA: SsrA-binding protein SmpB [Candidatus Saccharimonadales bacterium]